MHWLESGEDERSKAGDPRNPRMEEWGGLAKRAVALGSSAGASSSNNRLLPFPDSQAVPSAVPKVSRHSLSPPRFPLILTPLFMPLMIVATPDLLPCVSTASQVWLKMGKPASFSVSEKQGKRWKTGPWSWLKFPLFPSQLLRDFLKQQVLYKFHLGGQKGRCLSSSRVLASFGRS